MPIMEFIMSLESKIIENEQLVSCMNNTKWNMLIESLDSKDYIVEFRTVYIDGDTWPENEEEYDIDFMHLCGNYKPIAWMDIKYIKKIHIGELAKPKIKNFKNEIIEILDETNIKNYEISEDLIRVYGYILNS